MYRSPVGPDATRTRPIALAVLAAGLLLAGAAGAATAQPDEAGDAGPPSDLPDPAPDFVGDVLGAVGDFVGGSIEGLGDTVSGLTPGGDADG